MDSSSRYRFRSRSPKCSRSSIDNSGSAGFHSCFSDEETTVMVRDNEVLVTVTSKPQTVEGFLRDVRRDKPLIVGLDEECLEKENRMALLQICIDKQCLLFQVAVAGTIPDDLKTFLAGEQHVFVGAGIAGYMDRLRRHHNIELSKAVELQAMAPFVIRGKWSKVGSLKIFGQDLLGVDKEKGSVCLRTKDWDRPRLSNDKIKYACTDAFVSYKIGEILQKEHEFDLHLTQSPVVRAGGGGLLFVDNNSKRISRCPACHKAKNWMWNEAIDHAVRLSSDHDDEIRRSHKLLLLNHGFQVNEESDDSESDDGEA